MRNWWALAAVGLVVAVTFAFWMSRGGEGGGPSALAQGAGGWFVARLYLEGEGGRSRLLDRAFDGAVEESVVAITFPWRRLVIEPDFSVLRAWVRRGGTLVIGASGRRTSLPEERLLGDLGVAVVKARQRPPLAPLAWRRHVEEEWILEPGPALGGGQVEATAVAASPRITVAAMERVPRAPEGAQIFYQRASGAGSIFSFAYGKGRVVVLPADALSNAKLRQTGNARLLASLAAWLGPSWAFDEYHHGLVGREQAAAEVSLLPFDLFFVHLGLLYGLALWALGRRFGPAWREPPVRAGSAASFLLGLGRLHDRLKHHPAAAALLLERAAEIDPAFAQAMAGREGSEQESWKREAATADREGLVRLARRVAELRGGKP